jgi:hypothetical protein
MQSALIYQHSLQKCAFAWPKWPGIGAQEEIAVNFRENDRHKPTITFETKCYENDWEYLLRTDRLKRAVALCNYPFDRVVLYINNVNYPRKVGEYAERLVRSGVIDEVIHVSEHAEETLDAFGCTRDSFVGGYYYSIAEMVGIHLCSTDYLLHFSSDTIMANGEEWIRSAIEKMEENDRIIVANPTWNDKSHRAEEESVAEDEKFYIGNGFSDQCYLIAPARFRSPIYNEKNEISERNYPKYGGESFEKRVNAYMRNHGYVRVTSKKASYRHENFPRNRFGRKATLYFAVMRSHILGNNTMTSPQNGQSQT